MTIKNEEAVQLVAIDDIQEGQTWKEKVTITQEMMDKFIDITQDRASAHVDAEHAQKMGFDGCIVHGFLVSVGYSRILGMFLPGANTVIQRAQLDMIAPVYVGDTLEYTVTVERVVAAVKTVQLKLEAANQDGTLVNKGKTNCVFRL